MIRTILALGGALLAVSCGDAGPAARWSAADIAEAEDHAERLTTLFKQRPAVDFGQFEETHAGSGTISGYSVTCAHLAPGAVRGRREGMPRVLIYDARQIADAPSHPRNFQILWDVAGC